MDIDDEHPMRSDQETPDAIGRRRFLKATGSVLAGGTAALAGMSAALPDARAHTPSKPPVIIGIPTFIIDTAPHTIAAKRGYFEERGLTVQILDTRAGVVAVQRGLSGDTVMGNSNVISWMQSIAGGVPNKAVLQTALYDPQHKVNGVLVRRKLWESGEIRSVDDVAGHTWAIHGGEQGMMDFSIRVTLEKFGVDPDRIKPHYIGFGDHPSAMASGTIDLTAVVDPLYTKMVDDGTGVPLPDPDTGDKFDVNLHAGEAIYGKKVFPIACTWAVPDFASRAPESLQAYYDGYAKATQFIQSYPEQAAEMIADITGMDLSLINNITWPAFNPLPRVKEIQAIADDLYDRGWMDRVDVARHTVTDI